MLNNARHRLMGNYRYLVEELRVNDIRNYLLEKGVLTDDNYEELDPDKYTTRQNVKKLIEILLKKGPTAYEIFCHALDECGYPHIAKTLKEYDFENSHNPSLNSLWKATETIEQYKREIDLLKNKVKTKEEFQKQGTSFVEEVCKKAYMEEYIVEYLYDYVATMECSFTVADNSTVVSSEQSPSMISESPRKQTCRIAIELAKDVITFMSADTKKTICEPNKYAKTMRRMTEHMINTNDAKFENFTYKISMTDADGFGVLQQVADDIFANDQVNWGRIVALYVFGWFVVKTANEQNMTSIANYTGDYIGKYVAKNVSDWIQKQGGWESFEKFFAQNHTESDTGLERFNYLPSGRRCGIC